MTKRKGKSLAIAFLVMIFFVQAVIFAHTDAHAGSRRLHKAVEESRPPYVAALLTAPQTGQVLFEQDIHKPWPPASLAKMMLMLLVMEKVKQKAISLNDPVEVSARASAMGGSQVYLKPGEVFSLEEMMKAIVIHSANDAGEAVAERIGGSTEAFVDMMNQRAKELGLKDTKYFNVHGLPPERGQPADVTSAYDVAVLARELVKYPTILQWAATRKEDFRGGEFILENTNHLIGRFPGADGLKTGSYHEAGFNLAATAERNGLRLISVTLGSPTNKIRFSEAARLLSMGFNNYEMYTAMKAGEAVAQEVRVKGGTINALRPVVESPAQVLIRRSEATKVKSSVQLSGPVWAPLKKGAKLGELTVMLGDKFLGKFALVSNQGIERSNFVKRFWDQIF
jgi:serine-type D-Ala-D-Ala carboxypeptidase (penicillin-binding protein 5/6)